METRLARRRIEDDLPSGGCWPLWLNPGVEALASPQPPLLVEAAGIGEPPLFACEL